MFGDLVPNNSPHLRKSGSRSVVFDVGTNELGNSAEENFLHSTVSNVMKGMSSPLPSVAIMPSPVLLWRFKFAGCIKNQYYTQSQYDEVRSEWSEFVYSYVGA
ncbi:uncharacterized protein LOC142532052 [Primulina tabacum]|uniref:uncharacterized protein LOC142532052 n=1 Tax=Primulina tabacum TaxID=48773 RepID=UPI003F59C6BD